jgi:pyruvate,water dikinase
MSETTTTTLDRRSGPGQRYVRWFADLSLADAGTAGGKGANLGELTSAGLPVPPGFVVTADAYLDAMIAAGLRDRLAAVMAGVDPARPDDLADRALQARTLVNGAELPDEIAAAISAAYADLQVRRPGRVAVRSSATGEDSAEASFAGMNETYTNVVDLDELLDRVRACWASVFGERVVTYRAARGLANEPAIAVVVQTMVEAQRSGVMFTTDPTEGASTSLVIEAAWGQGEVVVGGQVEPDTYVVDRLAGGGVALSQVRIGHKQFEIVAGSDGRDERRLLGIERARARVIDDAVVLELARLGLAAESHYGRPQDMEWCTDGSGQLWLVQSRPITTLGADQGPTSVLPSPTGAAPAGPAVLTGLAASHGRGVGVVRVLSSPKEGHRLAAGEVLVATMTKPDWLPIMRRAAAVVTDGGGVTCHAAIVSRELGIPAVVGTRTATTTLRDGEIVTVDADQGKVFAGALAAPSAAPAALDAASGHAPAGPATGPGTQALATRILVNLALPEEAERAAALPVDGVGLLRAELLVTDALGGRHPRALLAEGRAEEFVASMSGALTRIGSAFAGRPVIYRAIDFRSNEFRDLEGGDAFEAVEANPMIGYRGCYRYLQEPDLFGLELEALARARGDAPNLHLMIPFVRTAWELEGVFALIDASPLGRDRHLQRWVMGEVPSVVFWLPRYAALGAYGVSIGSNDLTQLVLGVDRDSEVVAPLFDEADGAVLDAIAGIIATAHDAGMAASLCGQAPSRNPAFAEHLVRLGIDSISIDPTSVSAVRALVGAAEQRLVLAAARGRAARAAVVSGG